MPPSLGSRGCGGGSRCWDGDGCRRGNLHVGHHGRGGHGHRLGHRRVVELDVPDLFCRDEDLPVVHERDLEGKHGTNECPDERIWFEATRVGQLIHMALELGEHVVRALLERFALHTLGVGDRLLRVRGLLLLGEVVLCRAQLLARFVVCLGANTQDVVRENIARWHGQELLMLGTGHFVVNTNCLLFRSASSQKSRPA